MPSLDDIRSAVARVASRYNILEVYLYESDARGEQTDESEINLRFLCGDGVGRYAALCRPTGQIMLKSIRKRSVA